MKPKDWFAFIALGVIWGSSFLWIKIGVQEMGPILLVAFRILFGILGLAALVVVTRPAWPRQRSTWLVLTFFGLTNNAIPYTLITWGEKYIDSAVAAILNCTTPLFTMVIAHFLLSDDRITSRRLLALLMGFGGVILLMYRDISSGGQGFDPRLNLLGQAAVLLATLSYAFSAIYARRTTQDIPPQLRSLIPLFGADLVLWTMAATVEAPLTLPRLPLSWVAVVWLGVLGVAVAVSLYFYLLHSIGPTRTTLVTYIFPLVGVVLGVVFLHERLDWNLVLGTLLVVGSIAIINR